MKNLTSGAAAAVGKVHNLPERPRDIEDDGEFHYAVLGPKAASESGKPSAEARRFLDEKTGPDSPRVYRNAVVLAVPSRDGLEVSRNAIREYLGWEEVTAQLRGQLLDSARTELLSINREAARKRIPDAIQQAYNIVVTVSEKNDVHAFKIPADSRPLFQIIKDDPRSRIQETAISAEAMLPGGPYDLWRTRETAHRVKDLVNAFAQRPQLPKMLNREAILDTLLRGCSDGTFVLRQTRPDKSVKTYWRQSPDETAVKDPGLEVVLPEAAILSDIASMILGPKVLPGLWAVPAVTVKQMVDFFAGGTVVKAPRDGYEEPVTIPKAECDIVLKGLETAIKDGRLWLTIGPASVFQEDVPTGLLTDDAVLQAPPEAISPIRILPDELADAWSDGVATGLSISVALSKKANKNLPWAVLSDAIDSVLRTRILERTENSGSWPCDYAGARDLKLRLPQGAAIPPALPQPQKPGTLVAQADLRSDQIQDLADQIGELTKTAAGLDLNFFLRIQLADKDPISKETMERMNELLSAISDDLRFR